MGETNVETEESALVILVPEAEDLVGKYRIQYDHAASQGVPAHITLLWPFISPTEITIEDHKKLTKLFSVFPCFDFALLELKRFPQVLYLAPSPTEKIVGLVRAIFLTFPMYPPYGGLFADINPHLTIAQSENNQLLEKLQEEIGVEAKPILPIYKKVSTVSLLEKRGDLWTNTTNFPLYD
jgi:hypothetical protein